MVTIIQDIRYGLRMLRKSPGFTAIAVMSLALAIGANTTVFSLYNAVMLKSLPVRQPRQLRVLNWVGNLSAYTSYCRRESTSDGQTKANVFSYPIYCELRDYAAETAELFAFSAFDSYAPLTVLVDGQASTAHGLIVSGNFFSGLGIEAWAGQTITPEHDQPQAEPVTVISHIAWQRYFNGAPQVIGKMGIRMALGATAWNLAWPVLRSALLMAIAGIAIGLLMVFAAVRLIRNYLFGVEPYDFGTIVSAAFILAIISILAAWIPAQRAAKVDPMEALRYE